MLTTAGAYSFARQRREKRGKVKHRTKILAIIICTYATDGNSLSPIISLPALVPRRPYLVQVYVPISSHWHTIESVRMTCRNP